MTKTKSQRIVETDRKMEEALAALALKQFSSIHQATKHFNIGHNTLGHRLAGGKSIAESRESAQLLTILEETALSQWITRLTASSYPVSQAFLREMAEEIRQKRVHGVNEPSIQLVIYEPIDEQWVQRFLQRHPHLKTAMSRSIELSCITDASPEVIKRSYEIFFLTIEKYGIKWGNVYNQDESGFAIGTKGRSHVVIDSDVKIEYQAQPGRRE